MPDKSPEGPGLLSQDIAPGVTGMLPAPGTLFTALSEVVDRSISLSEDEDICLCLTSCRSFGLAPLTGRLALGSTCLCGRRMAPYPLFRPCFDTGIMLRVFFGSVGALVVSTAFVDSASVTVCGVVGVGMRFLPRMTAQSPILKERKY